MKKFLLFGFFSLLSMASFAQSNAFPASGNVGIGTITPTRLLSVNGSAQYGDNGPANGSASPLNISLGSTFGNGTPGTYSNLKLDLYNDGVARYGIGISGGLMEFQAPLNAQMAFFVNGGTRVLNLTPNGYVGIGTFTPARPLSVNGVIQSINGGFQFPDGTIQITAATGSGNGGGFSTTNYNTWLGESSLSSNTIGVHNTAIGHWSLLNNKTGIWNTAVGSGSLQNNTTGIQNTAIGVSALWANTTGEQNTAVGEESLAGGAGPSGSEGTPRSVGNYNVGVGMYSLFDNDGSFAVTDINSGNLSQSGINNTAVGHWALWQNTTGIGNTAVGQNALQNNVTGQYNVALGANALGKKQSSYSVYEPGNFNIALGFAANLSAPAISKSIIIGSNSRATASGQIIIGADITNPLPTSNTVVIGNNAITKIGGAVGWSVLSDGRVKRNIQSNVPGLSFINELQPITYNYDLDAVDKIMGNPGNIKGNNAQLSSSEIAAKTVKQRIRYTGFVAQDVEKAARDVNFDFSGVDMPADEHGLYSLKYAEFVVPLVKAVQELSVKNDAKDSIINSLQNQINDLKQLMQQVLNNNNKISSTSTSDVLATAQNILITSASLEQNIPNPFSNITTIRYNIPQGFSSAQISITDNSGKVLKRVPVLSAGAGAINIDGSTLSAGLYYYTLFVNGTLISTKKMILTK